MAVQGDLNTALLACFQNVASNSSDVLNLSDPRNGSVPHVHNAETCSFLVEQYTKQYDNSQYTRELVTYI